MGKANMRRIAGAFVVGGVYAVIGQFLMVVYAALLGADSPFLMAAVLVSLGVLAFLMYVPGVHQRVQEKSGYGSMLPFNGFACGIAEAFEAGAQGGGNGFGVKSALKLVGFAVGISSIIVAILALVMHFI